MFIKGVIALLLILQACDPSDMKPDRRDRRAGRGQELYETTATVLEDGRHGPMLCVGTILQSLPPQCGDVRIANWDWGRVDGEERLAGTIWGRYHVTGTFDGKSFGVTDVGPPHKRDFGSDPIGTPCQKPEGGWRTTDPNRAGPPDVEASNAAVRRDPEFAGLWIHYLDAAGILLNVAFTANLERHEQEIREHWGGPLCVIEHERSMRRLHRIQTEELEQLVRKLGLQVLSTDIEVEDNIVELAVVVIDDKDREAIDASYGTDGVRILAALQPAT